MKIFISHASANKEYGNAIVELLRAVGVNEDEIIFTSNNAYGIPVGQNIFNWLKAQIKDNPFVIYLLSKEYYNSIACLNEMGACWVIENKHAVIFAPDFDLNSKEFQNGAIDPREIGFRYHDEEKVHAFIQSLSDQFQITKNNVIIVQAVKKYLQVVNECATGKIALPEVENALREPPAISVTNTNQSVTAAIKPQNHSVNPIGIYARFLNDILNKKYKNEDILLIQYMIETSRTKLLTGWQTDQEVSNIKIWEEINNLSNTLSSKYDVVVRKLEMRKLVVPSAFTGAGNTKEVTLIDEIADQILDLPQEIQNIINEIIIENNKANTPETDWGLPF